MNFDDIQSQTTEVAPGFTLVSLGDISAENHAAIVEHLRRIGSEPPKRRGRAPKKPRKKVKPAPQKERLEKQQTKKKKKKTPANRIAAPTKDN